MVNIKGKNVLLMKHYLGAWGWELQRGAAGDAVRLMRHAIQRAAADPFDEPNVREAVAVAALGMVEQLRQHRGPSDGLNLDDTAAFLGEIAEGKEMQIELQGSGGVVGQVRVSEGERSITTERVQRLAGAKWQLRLGPALSDVENLPNDYAIVGGHELMRFMEEGFARFKLGECGWREVCQEWRRAFDLLMYRTLIDPSPPGLLRRAFAASAMVLILSIPEAPDGAEDVSDLVPSPQMLEWWREAVGCVADGSTLAATLVHDDGYLHDVRFEHGELEGRSELGVLPTSVASTFARVEEPIPGLPGPRTRLRASAPIPRREKIGRNAPCPCGSGQKYKRCCGSDA